MLSKYLKRLKIFREHKKAVYNQSKVAKMIDYIESLETENEILRDQLKPVRAKKHRHNCTTCGHADFMRSKTNGNRMLDQPGKCLFGALLPHSFIQLGARDLPIKYHVNKWTRPGCPSWIKAVK